MKTIYCRYCDTDEEIYYDCKTQKWLNVTDNLPHEHKREDPTKPKNCSCQCGCRVDIRGTFEEIAGKPYLCSGCMHGDCDIEAMKLT